MFQYATCISQGSDTWLAVSQMPPAAASDQVHSLRLISQTKLFAGGLSKDCWFVLAGQKKSISWQADGLN